MKKAFENDSMSKMIPDEKALTRYLNNELNAEEKRMLEELINDDPLVGDAIEGLYGLKEKADLTKINDSLALMIEKQIRKKKKKKIFQPLGFPLWLILLITFTLMAILGGYVLISLMQK